MEDKEEPRRLRKGREARASKHMRLI